MKREHFLLDLVSLRFYPSPREHFLSIPHVGLLTKYKSLCAAQVSSLYPANRWGLSSTQEMFTTARRHPGAGEHPVAEAPAHV